LSPEAETSGDMPREASTAGSMSPEGETTEGMSSKDASYIVTSPEPVISETVYVVSHISTTTGVAVSYYGKCVYGTRVLCSFVLCNDIHLTGHACKLVRMLCTSVCISDL
jgi:hypothetical protein